MGGAVEHFKSIVLIESRLGKTKAAQDCDSMSVLQSYMYCLKGFFINNNVRY